MKSEGIIIFLGVIIMLIVLLAPHVSTTVTWKQRVPAPVETKQEAKEEKVEPKKENEEREKEIEVPENFLEELTALDAALTAGNRVVFSTTSERGPDFDFSLHPKILKLLKTRFPSDPKAKKAKLDEVLKELKTEIGKAGYRGQVHQVIYEHCKKELEKKVNIKKGEKHER